MFKHKKKYGQNFLKDEFTCQKIVDYSKIENKDVVEIGPGEGALTKFILKKCKSLQCIEIDNILFSYLTKKFSNYENFQIINQDFLKIKLKWEGQKILLANIPYNITSQIIWKIFENSEKFSDVFLTVQKEYAERIISQKNSKNYSKLSVISQFMADCKVIFYISANKFFPKPKVDSAFINIKIKKNVLNPKEKELFFLFTKNCFFMKRKKLKNNLKFFLSEEKINLVYEKLNLNENLRPQNLDWEDYLKLFFAFKGIKND